MRGVDRKIVKRSSNTWRQKTPIDLKDFIQSNI